MLSDAELKDIIDSATANVGKVIGSHPPLWIASMTKDDLLALARRVADAQREEDAKVAESAKVYDCSVEDYQNNITCDDIARIIRQRKDAK